MLLAWESLAPFLSDRARAAETVLRPRVPILAALFTARWGECGEGDHSAAFYDVAASALERRLDRDGRYGITRQSVGGASVEYDRTATLTGWLLPSEVAQLDELCGRGGGIRSVRAHAPDGVRFGNRARQFGAVDDCGCEGTP